jgi:NAD(P)-dependent dehydrogenase (short-subunit alcohol dehydrogenase family)
MSAERKHKPRPSRDRVDDKPKPPFPPQHQQPPGLEAKMTPQPEFEGAQYRRTSSKAKWRSLRPERPAQPDEIARAFVFFASEADSSYITGEVLTLLGGETRAA